MTQKMAVITPVVKKPGLDPEEPQNYRPICMPIYADDLQTYISCETTDQTDYGYQSRADVCI